ncbi:(2Fe-2S)-binding protein [Betaproteobacteria bacterium]|nr:(2Fe-2S)-binding protein [Betaproteobacteria bacterium]
MWEANMTDTAALTPRDVLPASSPLVGEDAPNFGKSAGEGAVQYETTLEHNQHPPLPQPLPREGGGVSCAAHDLIVIGAGPAGLAAAVTGSRHGLRVLLLDEQPAIGGQIYRNITGSDKRRARILGNDYTQGAELARLLAASTVEHWPDSAVWQVGADKSVQVLRNGISQTLRAEAIIVATGAIERPFPIPGWTLPGVMTAGAGQVLLKSAALIPHEPVVLAGCGPLLYLLAAQYLRAGVKPRAILDTSPRVDPRLALRHAGDMLLSWHDVAKGVGLLREIHASGVPFYRDVRELRLEGDKRLERVSFASERQTHVLDCGLALLHQGVVPNTQISWSLRAEHRWNDDQLCWQPVRDEWGQLSVPGIYVAGDGAAIGGARVAGLQGELAALGVAQALERRSPANTVSRADVLRARLRRHLAIRPFLDRQYRPRDEYRIPADEVIVCRCEEVTAGAIRALVALGCVGPNQAKSFSRCGMGPCQGLQCGLTVTELIAQAAGLTPQEVGYYRIRPPLKPLTLGQLAGKTIHEHEVMRLNAQDSETFFTALDQPARFNKKLTTALKEHEQRVISE